MNYLFHSPVDDIAETAVPQGKLLINWIGQAGFLLKGPGGKLLCVDPYLSNSVERFEGLEQRRMWWHSFSMERFQPDGIFLTHDHLDHTDPETLPLIELYAHPEAYFAPPSVVAHLQAMGMRRQVLRTIQTGETVAFHDMTLRAVYAKHTEDSIGLVAEAAGLKAYLTGDTSWCEELLDRVGEEIDILIPCINGKYGNLDIEQAVALSQLVGAQLTIPMHFGVIPGNTVRPEAFIRQCAAAGTDCLVMKPEENYLFSKQDGKVIYQKL